MTADLMTAKDVADKLGISENQVKRRTAEERWPCVRFSARTIRYRVEHVEQIIAMHETAADTKAFKTGQTARSRRRSA